MANGGRFDGIQNQSLREILGLPEQQPEPTSDSPVCEAVESLVGRIKELEYCEFLLNQILATLCMERNRKALERDPVGGLASLWKHADKWNASRAANMKKAA